MDPVLPGQSRGREPVAVDLTFLFVELFDARSLKRSRDEAAWVSEIARFLGSVAEAVENREGKVVELTGDGALATFERASFALGAALDLQEELLEERRSGLSQLHCRIGLASGEAYAVETAVDRWAYLGTTVDVATRLCRLANGDAILLSESVLLNAELGDVFSPNGIASQRPIEELFGEVRTAVVDAMGEPVRFYRLRWQAEPEIYATTEAAATALPGVGGRPDQRGGGWESPPRGLAARRERLRGTVTELRGDRGYGHISYTDESGLEERIFFHRSSVVGNSRVEVGSTVRFLVAMDGNGRTHAESVVVVASRLTGCVSRMRPSQVGVVSARDLQGNKIEFLLHPADVEAPVGVDDPVIFAVDESSLGLVARHVKPTGRTGEHPEPGTEPLVLGSVEHGVVSRFDVDQGFGTIDCRGHRVFAHFTEVMAEGRTLLEGDRVSFAVTPGRGGTYRAVEIQVVGRGLVGEG